jgi:hypothetical protein
VSSQFKPRPLVINARVPHSCRSLIAALGGIESRILATSFVVAVAFFDLAPTEGAATTEISGFWADYGLHGNNQITGEAQDVLWKLEECKVRLATIRELRDQPYRSQGESA